MAHPAKILKELQATMPNAPICHWIFGILHSSRSGKATGLKGLLAASEKLLIFKSGSSKGESFLLEAPLEEVKEIEVQLQGTASMIIHFTDGGHMEMSYISRGDTKEFTRFLKTRCENLNDVLLPSEKFEQ